MTLRMIFAMVLGIAFVSPVLSGIGEKEMSQPQSIATFSKGDWILIRKGYCIQGCGRSTLMPRYVDLLIFKGDTLRGRGFQNISTPFGRQTWQPLYQCDIQDRRWISLDKPTPDPFVAPESALTYCREMLPKEQLAKFARLNYTSRDSLTLYPWELRKSGDGWVVLHKRKPVDPSKLEVDTPWGHMRWDKARKIWLCDKKVVPNDFR